MPRRGISLSMTYVVVGLILLATAVSVIFFFSGGISDVGNVLSGQRGESAEQIARENCLTQKQQLCQQDLDGRWYEVATYEGTTCEAYWPDTTPPGCGE